MLAQPKAKNKTTSPPFRVVKFRSLASASKHPPAGLKRLRRLMEFGFIRVLLPTQVKITLSPKHVVVTPALRAKAPEPSIFFNSLPTSMGALLMANRVSGQIPVCF